MEQTENLKLFMVLLGSKAPARNVEQHDYFFGIAHSLKALVPRLKAFWPEAGDSLHIDGWREITCVDSRRIHIAPRQSGEENESDKLFFINLGGYTAYKLEEQHYTLLTIQPTRALAVQHAKRNVFFKTNTVRDRKGANAHIDEKYGIDVDDIYRIDDLLSAEQKESYRVVIDAGPYTFEDEIHLGYFQLHKI
ncbi:DUF1543 domain-containing protein [Pedobacter sp. SYP-B3415]|uniref:DUF1543 domain-containing protein n=1 Tax=Pedobacter sp. SYP-B3415 TaxID=2496641 RepID=UPI00101CD34D|nr:DUF1543 domain-containing protein [Pedobacter sp. SYP-B3415]